MLTESAAKAEKTARRLKNETLVMQREIKLLKEEAVEREEEMQSLRDENAEVHNLRVRFEDRADPKIYTNIGTILVAINPYVWLPDSRSSSDSQEKCSPLSPASSRPRWRRSPSEDGSMMVF